MLLMNRRYICSVTYIVAKRLYTSTRRSTRLLDAYALLECNRIFFRRDVDRHTPGQVVTAVGVLVGYVRERRARTRSIRLFLKLKILTS